MAPTVPRLRRPLAVLVAVLLGLGGMGTAVGAGLGGVAADASPGHSHRYDDPHVPRFGR